VSYMTARIILIGGSPTAGKSYTARKIAEWLKMPWISTDTIREQMRKRVKKQDYPALFYFADATPEFAVEYLNGHSAEDVVRDEVIESKDVWKGVLELLETKYAGKSIIIEGVAILPFPVSNFLKKEKNTKALFLIDEDIARVRKTIFTRGLWDEADKYPDDVKEKEVEWVLAFNEYIKKEAKKYKLPVVSIGNRKDYLEDVKRIIES
jgi:2-phosphoglycerate kinase